MTVVTRFAPSPTGYLHIGGARTALFCWLYARAKGGKFLLRIEDTDKERSTQAAIDAILDGLNWLGLGGDEPPVLQSTRAGRHAEVAHELVKRGAAYRAYETPAEIQEILASNNEKLQKVLDWRNFVSSLRSAVALNLSGIPDSNTLATIAANPNNPTPHEPFHSNERLYQWLTEQQIAANALSKTLSQSFKSKYRDNKVPPPPNVPFVIRLRMPDEGELTVHDHVQGTVTRLLSELDDLIILRSDGTPTYMLAVVVDDHDMGVTHVIRGDDHFLNTFRQLPIYHGMGWPQPEYAHVPLIHGPDGKKLAKRTNAVAVDVYRDELGYLPEAMRNYLLRLGWSHGDDEIISDAQAIEWFDLSGLNKAPARLDFAKLDFVNKHYMALADDQRIFDLWAGRPEAAGLSADVKERIRAAMPHLKSRAANIVGLTEQARFLTDIRPIQLSGKAADQVNAEARARLAALLPGLEGLTDWSEPVIKEELAQFCAANGIGMGKIGPVLRAVLTGGAPAPDIALVLALLGRNEAFARIRDHAQAAA